jgi:AraC-like DNA-binding protein
MLLSFEKVKRPPDTSFLCVEFCGPALICPYHVHPEFEIAHIVSSNGSRLIGDHVGDFGPGDLVMIGGGLPHIYFHHNKPGKSKRWARSRCVQFLPDCLGASFFELPEMRGIQTLLARSNPGLQIDAKTTQKAIAMLDALCAAPDTLRVPRFLELLHVLAQSQAPCSLASLHYRAPTLHRSSVRIERALAYINDHLFDRVTLGDVSRAASMSPQGFSRFFPRLMGRTFIEYLTELRIGAACRQLIETERTVTEICFTCGFNNLSNFNRHFYRMKKLSPREYRQRFYKAGQD